MAGAQFRNGTIPRFTHVCGFFPLIHLIRIHDDNDFGRGGPNGGCDNFSSAGTSLKTSLIGSGGHAQNLAQHSPAPQTPCKSSPDAQSPMPLAANWKLFDELMGEPKTKNCGTSPLSLEYSCLGPNLVFLMDTPGANHIYMCHIYLYLNIIFTYIGPPICQCDFLPCSSKLACRGLKFKTPSPSSSKLTSGNK